MKIANVALLLSVVLLMGAAGPDPDSALTLGGIAGLLREFGFPIFVAVWFMWRLEKRVETFTESINKLLTIVTVMSKSIDENSSGRTRTRSGMGPVGKDVA